jgi:hypothetical protein
MIICPVCHISKSHGTLHCKHQSNSLDIEFVYDSNECFSLDIKTIDSYICIGANGKGKSYFIWSIKNSTSQLEIDDFEACDSLNIINKYFKLNIFT